MNEFLLNVTRFAMLAFLLTGMVELGLGAAQNFQDPKVNVMVIVSAVVGLGVLPPTARAMGKCAGAGATVISLAATAGKDDIKVKRV